MSTKPKDYRSELGVDYVAPSSCGCLSIEVLRFLWGKPWDEVALAYVHALRPTQIRVTDGGIKLNSRCWRVTVYVGKKDTILKIEQEVEVGLPDGVAHGSALEDALHHGLKSKQVRWHQDADGYIYDGIAGKYFKTVGKRLVPYPTARKVRKSP